MIAYMYEHFDSIKLIICCSDGTEYQHYVDSLIELEVESTYQFVQLLKGHGYAVREINSDLCHMLAAPVIAAYLRQSLMPCQRKMLSNTSQH